MTHIYTLTYLQIMYISNIYILIERNRYTYIYAYINSVICIHKLDFCLIYNVIANITLHHTYTPHIHLKYDITHIHPNMTFQIIPIAYTTYIHTSYIHTQLSKLEK